ncbi:hypothetical protein [Nocardiopsis sp. CC223A]|uniref:hypothetical protein n=1 Tax=Nocardiopsis sp. CC223A TaxID=3044051 RepID=UPI00278C0D99|nr:hypothetical protein [Nocardiopsis sp. CC223A]
MWNGVPDACIDPRPRSPRRALPPRLPLLGARPRERGDIPLIAPPAQTLALLTHLVTWTIELDQAWEHLEGAAYAQVRDAHPARGPLAALRVVRESAGVTRAVQFTGQGPHWCSADLLGLGPIDRGLYAEHLAGRPTLEMETPLLDLWVTGDALANGRGRTVLATVEPPRWQAGDEAPHDQAELPQQVRDAIKAAVEIDNGDPAQVQAEQAALGNHFLTLLVNGPSPDGPLAPEDPLNAWYALMRLLARDASRPALSIGGNDPVYLFKGPTSRKNVRDLATVARALSAGRWEVIEGYRTPLDAQEPDEPTRAR